MVKGRAILVEERNAGPKWVEIARQMAVRGSGQDGLKYLDSTVNELRRLFFIEPKEVVSSTGGWAKRYKHYDWKL